MAVHYSLLWGYSSSLVFFTGILVFDFLLRSHVLIWGGGCFEDRWGGALLKYEISSSVSIVFVGVVLILEVDLHLIFFTFVPCLCSLGDGFFIAFL